jgi:hypothetical protein
MEGTGQMKNDFSDPRRQTLWLNSGEQAVIETTEPSFQTPRDKL